VSETAAAGVPENRVVVGVDGSKCGYRALEYAAGDAQRSGSVLQVVTVYNVLPTYGSMAQPVLDQEAAEQTLTQAMRRVQVGWPDVDVKGEAVFGPAAQVLVDASKDARLLVVGTRGHSQVVGILLGSVSEYVVHHAHCTTTVVR